ncbi:MAG: GDP-mannose 4,6-dehydratase [Candidatus Magasanikbacteria bacterium RIFCSPLOWO2_01_FULL_43_20b]|uniref:GDP-mannose 4,6-dehydratase n=1 Tax=Candidatus Magasanikbacteria bacterium RIFCSPLOWO2_12_FULL_43_12 TaxID=1798692 RepID=A0A1F6MS40_9BACT|nr:MAG: GDP-mannose 4,6-dehydratase [Candidatus Magasanikbacteria bacterium RIFCSPLOWO2_02_FULL_43_22]OGH72450.1 MAG: GDP-mannose 4,6-dehydratase [Candidatus Magasanikbacteria bacterium RIFCSPHIGHO2_02_FULL_44_13]OGH73342.1 MAG: GDP-mannose 4,6-dehydratase [Candidatus Magasanikbacteria bacterium RIFCSPLOWO2_01_FULL_43_20b]OGH74340.1 MAG: GDP-mannose 4,6-dehydratase [Candidatus Magasanikbacteria bacterium RIFCSPLOWO2_12_FULL_43_12]
MPKQKIAFITGITGQDGSYLAELLLSKGYKVHGFVRRNSILYNYERLEVTADFPHNKNLLMHYGDMTDSVSITNILAKVKPDEIYNLAAQSHVKVSFETPLYTAQTSGIGVLNLLESVRALNLKSKIYQASTSELYSGDPKEAPQNELTPFKPKSPYGAAKLYGFEIARIYRESYGMFISNGILFNHESERRGESFVTRKITLGIRDILAGKEKYIKLGNVDAKRDWGYAPEYVEAMWKILQQNKPDDFVIATGETHSVKEFLVEACKAAGLDWTRVLKIDEKYKRPNEVDCLCGDASKARKILGWKPKTAFKELVKIMVQNDIINLSR